MLKEVRYIQISISLNGLYKLMQPPTYKKVNLLIPWGNKESETNIEDIFAFLHKTLWQILVWAHLTCLNI